MDNKYNFKSSSYSRRIKTRGFWCLHAGPDCGRPGACSANMLSSLVLRSPLSETLWKQRRSNLLHIGGWKVLCGLHTEHLVLVFGSWGCPHAAVPPTATTAGAPGAQGCLAALEHQQPVQPTGSISHCQINAEICCNVQFGNNLKKKQKKKRKESILTSWNAYLIAFVFLFFFCP